MKAQDQTLVKITLVFYLIETISGGFQYRLATYIALVLPTTGYLRKCGRRDNPKF